MRKTARTAFIHGTILDGTKDMQPITGMAIIVEGKVISAIVDEDDITALGDCEIIDLNGAFIMPGLVNLHVHLAGNGAPKKKQADSKFLVKLVCSTALTRTVGRNLVAGYAKTQLMSGTTTIRTVAGVLDFDAQIRDEINAGKRVGPRILASNMAISVPEGHMAGSLGYVAHNAQEARELVDAIAEGKPDIIKLMITGGVLDAEVVGEPGVLRMTPEIIRAACERAHELGFKVAAHTESAAGVRAALENGVDSIEHGAMPDDEIIALFKERGSFLVTTISPTISFAFLQGGIQEITPEQNENGKIVFDGIIACAKECIAAGVPVGLGTDTACPYVTQYDMWRELVYFTEFCDVDNAFALHTATLNNARLAGVGNITGSIEVGKRADMIVTEGDPLEDLSALRDISMVVMEGQVHMDPQVKKIPAAERALDTVLAALRTADDSRGVR